MTPDRPLQGNPPEFSSLVSERWPPSAHDGDITSQRDRYAKTLGPDIGLEHLADVTLVRYPLRISLGLDCREQTLG